MKREQLLDIIGDAPDAYIADAKTKPRMSKRKWWLGGIAAVLCGGEDSWNVCLANPGSDVKDLGSRMAKTLNGRGGGKAGFFQGSLKATREEILAFFAGF